MQALNVNILLAKNSYLKRDGFGENKINVGGRDVILEIEKYFLIPGYSSIVTLETEIFAGEHTNPQIDKNVAPTHTIEHSNTIFNQMK